MATRINMTISSTELLNSLKALPPRSTRYKNTAVDVEPGIREHGTPVFVGVEDPIICGAICVFDEGIANFYSWMHCKIG